LPLLERVRVGVYLPDPHVAEYNELLRRFEQELTHAFGGCTVLRGLEGNYLSRIGDRVVDRINLIYSDIPLLLSLDFALVTRYTDALKRTVTEALTEEEVMVTVAQIYHVV